MTDVFVKVRIFDSVTKEPISVSAHSTLVNADGGGYGVIEFAYAPEFQGKLDDILLYANGYFDSNIIVLTDKDRTYDFYMPKNPDYKPPIEEPTAPAGEVLQYANVRAKYIGNLSDNIFVSISEFIATHSIKYGWEMVGSFKNVNELVFKFRKAGSPAFPLALIIGAILSLAIGILITWVTIEWINLKQDEIKLEEETLSTIQNTNDVIETIIADPYLDQYTKKVLLETLSSSNSELARDFQIGSGSTGLLSDVKQLMLIGIAGMIAMQFISSKR
ncbi:MAG: hypothetical protein HYW92_03875 [Nitrosarchaeum sp.]|nr:hypothetical protein [Nitrosarchaeum sp.]